MRKINKIIVLITGLIIVISLGIAIGFGIKLYPPGQDKGPLIEFSDEENNNQAEQEPKTVCYVNELTSNHNLQQCSKNELHPKIDSLVNKYTDQDLTELATKLIIQENLDPDFNLNDQLKRQKNRMTPSDFDKLNNEIKRIREKLTKQ